MGLHRRHPLARPPEIDLRFVSDPSPRRCGTPRAPRIGRVSTDLPKTSWKDAAPFRLGDVEVHPASGELRGRRGVERIRPLLMDLLLRLAAEPGEVVRRETLLQDVWPRRMVNDEVLSRAVAELRTALGDDARDARYVETLPKIGYRLVAEVVPLAREDVASAAGSIASAPPAPHRGARRVPWRILTLAALAVGVTAVAAWLGTRPGAPTLSAVERALLEARQVTSEPGNEVTPRFSPDGRHIAFAAVEAGGRSSRIVVQAVEGATRQVVGGADDTLRLSPAFFPDGKRLAYWRAAGPECAIVEVELATHRERTLVECSPRPRARFDLSPDGRWIVLAASPRPQWPAGLQLVDLREGARRTLTAPEPGEGDDLVPRFSPDGRRIAFFRGNDSHRTLWVIDRDTPSKARQVAKHDGLAYGVAWLGADGPLIVAADWLGFRALNSVDLASGEAKLLGARGARALDVGPRGEVVYENAVYSANLFRVDAADPRGKRPLWRSTRYTSQPELSPDARSVVFSSNRDGVDALYVAALDGAPRRIAGDAAARFMRPRWSADGRSILAVRVRLSADGSGVQEAMRIPVDGQPAEVLAPLGQRVNDVRETADGRWLVWGESSGHAMRLLRAPIAEPARSERLPWPLVSHHEMAGDRVVFAQPQLGKLTACRLSDLACELLPLVVYPATLYHWTVGPKSLYLRVEEGVARYDFAAGKVVETLPIEPSGAGTSLAVSRDEKLIVYAAEEGPAVDLMLSPPSR